MSTWILLIIITLSSGDEQAVIGLGGYTSQLMCSKGQAKVDELLVYADTTMYESVETICYDNYDSKVKT